VSTIAHARKRIEAILEEIGKLKQSEFPYSHPKEALEALEALKPEWGTTAPPLRAVPRSSVATRKEQTML